MVTDSAELRELDLAVIFLRQSRTKSDGGGCRCDPGNRTAGFSGRKVLGVRMFCDELFSGVSFSGVIFATKTLYRMKML
jgi:hypothetical protein